MPRARHPITTKKRGRPRKKDAEGGQQEPPKPTPINQVVDHYYNSPVGHIYDPIYNIINERQKIISKPTDLVRHWTRNKYDEYWIRAWHIHQQICLLKNEFFKTGDWRLWDIIKTQQEAEFELFVNQKITQYENVETLENFYTTNSINELKSRIPVIQQTFFSYH